MTPSNAVTPPALLRPHSRLQRVVLSVAGILLMLAELSRLLQLLESFRGGTVPPYAGGIISLSLSTIVGVQLLRGRWLRTAMCFLVLFIAIEAWATLQMPVSIDGNSFRYQVLLSRLPFMVVHLVCLGCVSYVRCALNRETCDA